MLEGAIQRKLIDFIGSLENETGINRLEICNFVYNWGNGRLPRPDEALEVIKRAEENFRAGRHKPGKEVIANMRKAIEPYL